MSVIDRLKAKISEHTAQLEIARREHVVIVNTLSVEAVDLQSELIKKMEGRLKFYDEWEDTREVKDLINKVEYLEEERANLIRALMEAGVPVPEPPRQ